MTQPPRPAVPADIADLRVQMMRLETMLESLAKTIQEHFLQRRESNEKAETDRKEESEHVTKALNALTAKVEKVDKRVEVVERDIGSIKIGWTVLVKAASMGSAITAGAAGVAAWVAWAFGFSFHPPH